MSSLDAVPVPVPSTEHVGRPSKLAGKDVEEIDHPVERARLRNVQLSAQDTEAWIGIMCAGAVPEYVAQRQGATAGKEMGLKPDWSPA